MSIKTTRRERLGLAGRKSRIVDPFLQTLVIPLPLVASAAEQATGITLPTNAAVFSVVVHITSASTGGSTHAIDLGIVGNADQLIDGAATTSAGYVGPTGGGGEGSSIVGGEEIAYQLGSADIVGYDGFAVITFVGDDD